MADALSIHTNESSSHSRSVSARITLDGAEVSIHVGANTHGSQPWPAPQCWYPQGGVSEADAPVVAAVVAVLFARYAEAYAKGVSVKEPSP